MVLLKTTPAILKTCHALPPDTLTLTELPDTAGSPISHSNLIALAKASQIPLDTLLRGTSTWHPPPPPKPEPSPEYLALKAQLLADQEAREYEKLTGQSLEQKEEEDPITPSLVFNILLSILFCAYAVFHVSKWYASDAVRVLLGLAAGLIVGISEVGIYSIYLNKVDRSKRKEKRIRERKLVLGPVESETGEKELVEKATQEIWGRGINGGVRRRVKEKWEKEQAKRPEI